MSRLYLVLVLVLGLFLFGCGEQPEQGAGGEVTESGEGGPSGGELSGGGGGIGLDAPELEVGQWITYGVDDEPQEATFGVLSSETFEGTECLWIQIDWGESAAQMLVDPAVLSEAFDSYSMVAETFLEDPAQYIRDNMGEAGDVSAMFTSEENMENALEFIGAFKMIRVDQGGGQILALDLSGVPDALEEMMEDPAFSQSFEQGFQSGMVEGEADIDEIMAELDRIDFGWDPTEVDVQGTSVSGYEFTMIHPDGGVEVVISDELPVIPLAHAKFTDTQSGEEHVLEVRGFGFDGVEDKLPGEAVQTMDAAMFLQMMGSGGGPGAGGGAGPMGGGM
ncbi:hypothetical protein GF402_10575 [Candidatus Fermentibacteria bacterium]|nr:hypothetical protein [Candidatus Fermentibacteria bacterium]